MATRMIEQWEECPGGILIPAPEGQNSGMIVTDLSTRWQSWVDSNFCFLVIKISIKFILWQEKVGTVTYVSLSYFVLYYLWMSYISPNLHLHLWGF